MLKTILISELGDKTKSYKSGSEGCIYNLADGTKIYKEFDEKTSKEIRYNKKNKLIRLEEITDILRFIPEINYLVDDDTKKYLLGYVMQKCDGITLDLACFDFEENSVILKKIKHYLEIFKEYNINYIDFKGDNIIVDEQNLETRILDVDNILIDKFDVDLIPENFERYIINGGKINFNGSLFSFNKMVFEILRLNGDRYYEKDNNILRFNHGIGNDIPDSIADNEYLIDYIDIKKIKKI